ncbi:uncharacterized protein MKZ38_009727 [Zalerion maritima]|uniref:Uncharacterized protein n=1 Tax=Zalerion maritima TaxID=339359 RepID=A0AAD5WUW2_9PEZI|nr:uncharacterized protein MKZ38_009727 [Zalerion maritima]
MSHPTIHTGAHLKACQYGIWIPGTPLSTVTEGFTQNEHGDDWEFGDEVTYCNNGLVSTMVDAWLHRNHVMFRPDDIWTAILAYSYIFTMLSFQCHRSGYRPWDSPYEPRIAVGGVRRGSVRPDEGIPSGKLRIPLKINVLEGEWFMGTLISGNMATKAHIFDLYSRQLLGFSSTCSDPRHDPFEDPKDTILSMTGWILFCNA